MKQDPQESFLGYLYWANFWFDDKKLFIAKWQEIFGATILPIAMFYGSLGTLDFRRNAGVSWKITLLRIRVFWEYCFIPGDLSHTVLFMTLKFSIVTGSVCYITYIFLMFQTLMFNTHDHVNRKVILVKKEWLAQIEHNKIK